MPHVVAYLRTRLLALPRTQRGASAVEYGLLIALIAIVMVGGVALIGNNLGDLFNPSPSSQTSSDGSGDK